MAELAMLADIQRTVYSEEVTRQLHVMEQARKNSPVSFVNKEWQIRVSLHPLGDLRTT